jgi:hypothetical protein
MAILASTNSVDHQIFTAGVTTATDLAALVKVSGAIGTYDWSGMSLQFDRPELTPTALHLRCQDNAASTTVSLMVSSNGLPSGVFRPYACKDAAGVLTDQTFTDDIHHGYLNAGDCFRFDSNGTGSPVLNIKYGGNVTVGPRL